MTTSPQSGLTLDRWLAWFETVHPKRIDLRLDRFIAVLDTLGLRAPPYKVVTVAGTNGKGSCVAMLESIYWHAGYAVGTFTSPHLWRFNERIRIDGVDAADSELVEVFEDVARALGTVTLSYFEASFVAALAVFRRHDPDVVILEVGMGGRLDATNALDTDCAMIVSIDLDHREWLGETRAVIGRGEGRNRAVGQAGRDRRSNGAAQRAGTRRSRERDSVSHRPRLRFPPRRLDVGAERATRTRRRRCLCRLSAARSSSRTPLRAPPSVDSLAASLPVTDAALAAGIANAFLRGRLERHAVDGVEWVFDVAHNPAAAAVLEASARRLPAAGRTMGRVRRDARQGFRGRSAAVRADGRRLVRSAGEHGSRRDRRGARHAARESRRRAHHRGRRRRSRMCRRARHSDTGRSRRRLWIVPYGGSCNRSASAILRSLPIGSPTRHMDQGLKERLVGAAVLVAIAVWLIPWVLDGPEGPLETNGSALQLPAAEEPMPMRTQTLRLGDAAEPSAEPPTAAVQPLVAEPRRPSRRRPPKAPPQPRARRAKRLRLPPSGRSRSERPLRPRRLRLPRSRRRNRRRRPRRRATGPFSSAASARKPMRGGSHSGSARSATRPRSLA